MGRIRNIFICLLVLLSIQIFAFSLLSADKTVGYAADAGDNTSFCFLYNGRQWKFFAKDFVHKQNTYENKYDYEKYGRMGTKQQKILTINRAVSLGFGKEMAFNYIYLGLKEKIAKIEKNVFAKAKDAQLTVKPKSAQPFTITKETIGVALDKTKLYEQIYYQYLNKDNIIIDLPVIKTMPQVTAEFLRGETNFRGGYSTSIASSSADRKHNIYRSLNALNGCVVQPNEQFSFNKAVGRRTPENGYRLAKIIVDGDFVDGNGGGVCQTSTTLYNAILLANLKINQANKHSQRVSYVPAGLDAMVNYGSSDLVFTNNTNRRIYIITKYNSKTISISVYGESLSKGVKYKTQSQIVKTMPFGQEVTEVDTEGKYCDKILYKDESFILKPGKEGVVIKSYLITYKNDQEIDRKLLRTDTYNPQNPVRIYGAKERLSVDKLIKEIQI